MQESKAGRKYRIVLKRQGKWRHLQRQTRWPARRKHCHKPHKEEQAVFDRLKRYSPTIICGQSHRSSWWRNFSRETRYTLIWLCTSRQHLQTTRKHMQTVIYAVMAPNTGEKCFKLQTWTCIIEMDDLSSAKRCRKEMAHSGVVYVHIMKLLIIYTMQNASKRREGHDIHLTVQKYIIHERWTVTEQKNNDQELLTNNNAVIQSIAIFAKPILVLAEQPMAILQCMRSCRTLDGLCNIIKF